VLLSNCLNLRELGIVVVICMGSSVITPEDVLESLMNDGTIDAIRLKIINQLKANVSAFGINIILLYIFFFLNGKVIFINQKRSTKYYIESNLSNNSLT